ncbi:MAG: RDD family protein [Oscillospiraceae bacterium]|nr:RDD family protein [Oscillospiraceae bacterium]
MIYDIQKASLLKRASAFLLDIILLVVLACGFGMAVSGITGFDGYFETLDDIRVRYETEYGVSLEKLPEEMTEQEQAIYDAIDKALQEDQEYIRCFNMILSLSMVIISLGLLLSYVVLEFIVPLLLKNGQTLGKKIFGIALMRADGVKVSTFALFVRALLGKYTLETMIPVLIVMMMLMGTIGIVGPPVLLGILVIEIVLMIVSKTNSTIHDYLAVTVAVDLSSQMIFETPEDMLEYKKQVQAEMANKAPY